MTHLPARNHWTIEDLTALPDDANRYEIASGWLLREPPAGARHGRIAGRLTLILGSFIEEHELGVTFTAEAGFVLARCPDTVRAPDFSFVRKDRYEAAGDTEGPFEGAPDLAVEVVSPPNRSSEIREKVADYLAAGTPLVWVVDPSDRTVVVFRTLLQPIVLQEHDLLTGAEIVPGFSVRVGTIFSFDPLKSA